jgi:hypothetical protein
MHRTWAFWPSLLDHGKCARVGLGDMAVQTQIGPAMTVGVEGSLLSRLSLAARTVRIKRCTRKRKAMSEVIVPYSTDR